MSEQKRYTAQKMREMADCIGNIKQSEMPSWREGEIITGGDLCRAAEMLRQAADAEDELAKAKKPDACPANPTNKMYYLPGLYCCDVVRYLQKETAQLKARLKEVAKECETDYDMRCVGCPCEHGAGCELTCGQVEEIVNKRQKDILRAARGDAAE